MNKFSKSNFLKISKETLDFQFKFFYPLNVTKEPKRVNLVFLNHDRNFSTFLTIQYLLKHGRVADIYVLSRSLFESIITMGLLSDKVVSHDLERYSDYQFIEICKTYSHLKRLGLERTSGLPAEEVTLVKQKREDYIKKFGKNNTTWTGKSLEENVKLVDLNYPSTCNENKFYEYLYCQIYRKGSQSTHASLAGLSKGVEIEKINLPNGTKAQRFKPNEDHLIFSCFHSIIAFASSVRFLGKLLNLKETENHFHKVSEYIINND